MKFILLFTKMADEQFSELENNASKRAVFKAVCKTLALMEVNLRHPSLQTHKIYSLSGPDGQEVFEAYVQQRTSGAYRIFWYYGPKKGAITIFSIITHPNIKH